MALDRTQLQNLFDNLRAQFPGEVEKFARGGWTFRDDQDYAFRRYRVLKKEDEILMIHRYGGRLRLRIIRGRKKEMV